MPKFLQSLLGNFPVLGIILRPLCHWEACTKFLLETVDTAVPFGENEAVLDSVAMAAKVGDVSFVSLGGADLTGSQTLTNGSKGC